MKTFLIVLFMLAGLTCIHGQDTTYAGKQIAALENALSHYQMADADDWMYFDCDSCLNPGDSSYVISFLRKNLTITKDLPLNSEINNPHFEKSLETALRKFQKRHGLTEDGILGTQTIDALNVPFTTRVDQIRQNLQHWKQLSETVREPYLLVNIPDFSLSIIDSGRVIQTIKVIVGRLTHPTPRFMGMLKYIVLNPSWVVPKSIAVKEIVPMLMEDPGYLERNHMEVYALGQGSKTLISGDSIDWKRFSKEPFTYQFEQTPGTWNALGKLKFIFPNEYDVYLHDTPEKHLFHHRKRTYSHGCIRLEKPELLAAWLLNMHPSQIGTLLKNQKGNTIRRLPAPVPVIIDYFTSWVGEDGMLQFREDVYHIENTIH